ncbi:MAG TPA: hypothetical protein VGC65_08450 [Bacteroidia bacterium]|jgi:hypothetical protein
MKYGYLNTKQIYYHTDADGIKTPHGFNNKCTKAHVKFYFNWQHHLTKLSPVTISLLFFLAERMHESTNEITHSQAIIRQFHNYRKRAGCKAITDAAVRKGFQQLKQHLLLINTPERGNYIVNPRFLFKESEEVRRVTINMLLNEIDHKKWHHTNVYQALGVRTK